MSRGPNKKQIAELRGELARRIRLETQITEARQAAAKLPKLEEEWRDCQNKVTKLLEEQDCKSDGNFGWESRISTLLAELLRQEMEGI